MNFSRFFIERPIFAAMLSGLILLAGLIAMPGLPISEYPEVVPPTVVVNAQYPGANPSTIAETVACRTVTFASPWNRSRKEWAIVGVSSSPVATW